MAVAQGVGVPQLLRDNSSELAGGVVGVGAPVALRETVDVRGGQEFSLVGEQGSMLARLTRPSVAWGLGVGGVTGLLWLMDMGGRPLKDFYLTHSLTAIPAGAASALMPREASGGGGTGTARTRIDRATSNGETGGGGRGEFAPADGTSTETEPAN